MDKLKYIRIQQGDDQYHGDIPIGVDAENVDFKNGSNLQQTLGDYDYTEYGNIKEKFDSINNDIVSAVQNEANIREDQNDALNIQINSLKAAVGSPLVAFTIAAMTDKTKVYVYVGNESGYINGNWYYWNGSVWASGGIYNSVALKTDKSLSVSDMAADAAMVGELKNKINILKNNLYTENIDINFNSTNGYINATGGVAKSNNWKRSDFKRIDFNAKGLLFTNSCSTNKTALSAVRSLCFYSSNNINSFISGINLIQDTKSLKEQYVSIPDNAKYIRYCVHENLSNDFYIKQILNINQLFDNDDIKIQIRICHTRSGVNFGPSLMLIRLKRSKFEIGISNNNTNYINPYEATWNAYAWLMNNPKYLFATNCNFSGGASTSEVAQHHYPMRYEGINYPEGEGGQPKIHTTHTRPFFAFDTENQQFKYFPMDTTLQSIPSKYDFAFACGNLLLENGVVVAGVTEDYMDSTIPTPRNIFGWDDDYYYIFFCEGRNTIDAGLDFPSLISQLQSYGVQNAINMDGGGSVCVATNMPNTVKINKYQDDTLIRPTSLNLHYRYYGNQNGLSVNAAKAILSYIANVYTPYKTDLLNVLSDIVSPNKIEYVYDQTKQSYKLEIISNE